MDVIYAQAAAGTTHTNSTDEAVLCSATFPANFWQAGKVVKARALVTVDSSNSTDTLTAVARFGAAALTGTAIGTTSALDVADADLVVCDVELFCRTGGSAGVIVATVLMSEDAAGTAAGAHGSVVTAVDCTAATYVSVTGDWSVAHADNQATAQSFVVLEGSAQ